ncbi:sulfotransferase domain-containing protein [Yunchengibacter salinarum]|uniref:sulfotransferase domain-containing protein n=1 Tax=Yunchengibacter salinarum TaxID=3133399 RepID=UPI0035B5C657
MKGKIFISTHHKAGTQWLRTVFANFCRQRKIFFFDLTRYARQAGLPEDSLVPLCDYLAREGVGPVCLFDDHSRIVAAALNRSEVFSNQFRGLHMVRDPRDIVISGARYHLKSDEQWLHAPQSDFDGQTYRQKLESFETFSGQVLFEADHAAGSTAQDMAAFPESDRVMTLRYEDMVEDRKLTRFREAFRFLELPEKARPVFDEIVRRHSLFGEAVVRGEHVSNGRPRQWQQALDAETAQALHDRYAGLLFRYGYA